MEGLEERVIVPRAAPAGTRPGQEAHDLHGFDALPQEAFDQRRVGRVHAHASSGTGEPRRDHHDPMAEGNRRTAAAV